MSFLENLRWPEIIPLWTSAPMNGEESRHTLLPREEASSIQESDRKEPSGVEINFISGKQARHKLRRGEQGFLAWISDADKETGGRVDMKELIDSDSDISSGQRTKLIDLLDEFSDVIRRSLPSRLPPLRKVNHDIDLDEGSVPPSRPFYRLSRPELDELQRQISTLLESWTRRFYWAQQVTLWGPGLLKMAPCAWYVTGTNWIT